jgi:hypothetical protein
MTVSAHAKQAVRDLLPGRKGVADEIPALLGLSGTTDNPANVAAGGTGRVTLLAHAVLVGAGTSAVTPIAAAAAGTVFVGKGVGADPGFAAMSGDVTITSSGVTAIGAAKVKTAMIDDAQITAAKLDDSDDVTFNSVDVGTDGFKVSGTKVVGAQQPAIAASTLSATTGSLPSANGTTVFSNAATPTVAELLDAVVELTAKVKAIRDALNAHGLIG